jgi:hypothetical protein
VAPALRAAALRGAPTSASAPIRTSPTSQVRPSIAFIVDIRRDNRAARHLFKALFELSGTRIEYEPALRPGRPGVVDGWRQADMDRLSACIDDQPSSPKA